MNMFNIITTTKLLQAVHNTLLYELIETVGANLLLGDNKNCNKKITFLASLALNAVKSM